MNETRYRVSEEQMPRTRSTAKAARYLCVAIAAILHNLVIIANPGAARLVPERGRDRATRARHRRIPVHPGPQKPARKVAEGTGSNTGYGRAGLQVAARASASKPPYRGNRAHNPPHTPATAGRAVGPPNRPTVKSIPHPTPAYRPSAPSLAAELVPIRHCKPDSSLGLTMLVGTSVNPAKTCRLRGYIWFNWSLCTSSPAYSISFLSSMVMILFALFRFAGFPEAVPSSARAPGPVGLSILSSAFPDPFT